MSNLPVNPGVNMNTLKSKILNPALTSFYSVIINRPKDGAINFIESELGLKYDSELMELSCIEASLPGSSLATLDVNNDYMGISQKHAYRRMYDGTMSLTFLVTKDSNYQQIRFFESWIKYISGEDTVSDPNVEDFYFRSRYPSDYRSEFTVAKYEKDLGSSLLNTASSYISYVFKECFPISINSMPVSYEASDTLKCTATFSYTRYIIRKEQYVKNTNTQPIQRNNVENTQSQINQIRSSTWRYSQNELDQIREEARQDTIRKTRNNSNNFLGGSRRPGSTF